MATGARTIGYARAALSGEQPRWRRTHADRSAGPRVASRAHAGIASGRGIDRLQRIDVGHRKHRLDQRALARRRLQAHRAALGLDPVAHAEQAMGAARCGVESKPTPLSRTATRTLGVDAGERHLDLGGLGVLGDVGQRLLHQAVDGELRRLAAGRPCSSSVLDLELAALAELAHQDLERGHQAEVAERRRPQVFDDAALERDAAVERLVQVAGARGPRACVLPRRDLSRAASSLAAVSRAPSSSCSSRARRLRSSSRTVCRWCASSLQLRGAALHLGLEVVALACMRRACSSRMTLQRRGLPQVHEEREQAQRRHRGDADAVEQQGLVDALAALRDLRGSPRPAAAR